jgi:predicted metal-dependent hydrolase
MHPDDAPQYTTAEAQLFHEGLTLFNEADWFEAHEVWEDIWHTASGVRKHFYQGLIQCAVTIEHIRRGNPRGVRSVWATAQEKFTDVPSPYMGIDVSALLGAMQRFVQPVLDLPDDRFAPGASRGQAMPVDLAQAPTIRLLEDPFAADRA